MKISKKIILSLGATTIVAAPLQTIISLGNKKTVTPEDTKAVNNATKDQQYVNAITQAQIFKVVTTSFTVKGLASAEAKIINSTASTYSVGPHNVQVIIHATSNDIKGTLSYTVEGIQLNAARGNPDTFPKLGATITGFFISDQNQVNAINANQILKVVQSAIIPNVQPTVSAKALNAKTLTVGNGIKLVVSATAVDTTGILTYKVVSLVKGTAIRAQADLAGLGGQITGLLSNDQKAVNAITQLQISNAITIQVYKQIAATAAANFLNNVHGAWSIRGTSVVLHATGDDATQTLTYTVVSITKGTAARATKDLPLLGGTFTGFKKSPEQVYVDELTSEDVKIQVAKVISSVNEASVNAALVTKHSVFIAGPHNVKVTLTAVGNDNTKITTFTVTSATLSDARRLVPSGLNGSLAGSAPSDNVVIHEMSAAGVRYYLDQQIRKNNWAPGEFHSHLNNNVWVIPPYNVNITTACTEQKTLSNGNVQVTFKVRKAWKGNAVLENSALDKLGGTFLFRRN